MINWTEEDVKFICNSMINPAMEQIINLINTSYDSHSKIIDSVVEALSNINYQQQKEISFLKMLIIQHLHLDPQKVDKIRDEYFKQFDELNNRGE